HRQGAHIACPGAADKPSIGGVLNSAIYWLSGGTYVAIRIGIAVCVVQIAYLKLSARDVDGMQWLGLGLVAVFGGATLAAQDPRLVMIKPTLMPMAIACVMLGRGWMQRYLPPLVSDNVSEAVLTGTQYAWAALMLSLGAANLIIALTPRCVLRSA